MIIDPRALKVYVDGSAFKNPGGSGGVGVVAVYPDDFDAKQVEVFSRGYEATNSARTELMASIEALKFARKEVDNLKIKRVIIVTDSLYVYEGQNRVSYWRDNEWKKSNGSSVENIDLWKEFINLRPKVRARVDIGWEKGKTSEVLKAVDKSAKRGSANPTHKDFGFSGGKVSPSKSSGSRSAEFLPSNIEYGVCNIYRYQFSGKDEIMVRFDLINEDGEYQRYKAYALKNLLGDTHRHSLCEIDFDHTKGRPFISNIIVL